MDEGKIVLDHQELCALIDQHRQRGERIVFTNGCFDLLHVGHIRCLKGAKEHGDILVVAVNSDASMKCLKRKGRPLMPEDERLEILASLRFVDYLTLFSDPTVDRLLTLFRPHVFAKGTDYTVENVPERNTALFVGAKIAIVGDPKDHSSTHYLKKMCGSAPEK
jgi:rfaE bifunctional protein nucleotidyltransferase chain/domain